MLHFIWSNYNFIDQKMFCINFVFYLQTMEKKAWPPKKKINQLSNQRKREADKIRIRDSRGPNAFPLHFYSGPNYLLALSMGAPFCGLIRGLTCCNRGLLVRQNVYFQSCFFVLKSKKVRKIETCCCIRQQSSKLQCILKTTA